MERSVANTPLLKSLTAPLGMAYALGMRLRNSLFFKGIRPRYRPEAPVVSVGNISMGGSGKTPLCSWLMGRALDRGLTPCLLTRGYGGRPPQHPYTVRPDSPWRHSGDEPLLLAQAHPRALVLADPVRTRAARLAESRHDPGLFILDDGFQHLAVHRDLDLVLLRPDDLGKNWNRVVPAGRWREDASALGRAHAFLLKCPEQDFAALEPLTRNRLEHLGKPVFAFSLEPDGFFRIMDSAPAEPPDGPYVLATAVAEPDQVRATVEKTLGRPPKAVMAHADHHPFSRSDAQAMARAAGDSGWVLTTAKDAVKLREMADERFLALGVAPRFHGRLFSQADFPSWLDAACPIFTQHTK